MAPWGTRAISRNSQRLLATYLGIIYVVIAWCPLAMRDIAPKILMFVRLLLFPCFLCMFFLMFSCYLLVYVFVWLLTLCSDYIPVFNTLPIPLNDNQTLFWAETRPLDTPDKYDKHLEAVLNEMKKLGAHFLSSINIPLSQIVSNITRRDSNVSWCSNDSSGIYYTHTSYF